jgi:hypothetical protein
VDKMGRLLLPWKVEVAGKPELDDWFGSRREAIEYAAKVMAKEDVFLEIGTNVLILRTDENAWKLAKNLAKRIR